jgi:hypothetical protein
MSGVMAPTATIPATANNHESLSSVVGSSIINGGYIAFDLEWTVDTTTGNSVIYGVAFEDNQDNKTILQISDVGNDEARLLRGLIEQLQKYSA